MSLNHPLLSINLLQYAQSKLTNNAIDISDIFILYLIIVCNIITKSMNRALYYLKYVYIFITKVPSQNGRLFRADIVSEFALLYFLSLPIFYLEIAFATKPDIPN